MNSPSCRLKLESGIALIAVMVALMVLSAIAAALAVSIQTEARIEGADFESLQAEQLARAGQEFAAFLEGRGAAIIPQPPPGALAGLPFESVVPGFHYRIRVDNGSIDIYYESDNGRINPSTAPPELVNSFFGLWTGDLSQAQIIADSIADWADLDEETRPNGAESGFYAGLGLLPRNGALGIADLPLVRGLTAGEFHIKLNRMESEAAIRQSLDAYLTDAPTGPVINVNFAPELVLQAIPGLSASHVRAITSLRRDRPFVDMNAVQALTGLNPDAQAWRYLTVSRNQPAILTIARLNGNQLVRSERRITYSFTGLNLISGAVEPKSILGRIEKNVFPGFL